MGATEKLWMEAHQLHSQRIPPPWPPPKSTQQGFGTNIRIRTSASANRSPNPTVRQTQVSDLGLSTRGIRRKLRGVLWMVRLWRLWRLWRLRYRWNPFAFGIQFRSIFIFGLVGLLWKVGPGFPPWEGRIWVYECRTLPTLWWKLHVSREERSNGGSWGHKMARSVFSL